MGTQEVKNVDIPTRIHYNVARFKLVFLKNNERTLLFP